MISKKSLTSKCGRITQSILSKLSLEDKIELLRDTIATMPQTKDIVAYSNNDISSGKEFILNNFKKCCIIKPSYYYVKDYKIRVSKHKIKIALIDLKETELHELRYDKLWNTSYTKWRFSK